MSITIKDFRILLIDGAMEILLEKSRRGAQFNLYDELAAMGFTDDEITAATNRRMEKMRLTLQQLTAQLIHDFYSRLLRS
ncbi:MAG: hypothetical protein WC528_00320 [Patescibacteria group bacterium]